MSHHTHDRRPAWAAVGWWLLALVALRQGALVIMDVVSHFHQLLSPWTIGATLMLACWWTVANWAWQRGWLRAGPAARSSVLAWLAITLAVLGARYAQLRSQGRIPTRDYVSMEIGRYPYPGNQQKQEDVGWDAETRTRILPEGHRRCSVGEQPSPVGEHVVALVGDSFVFGKGLHDEDTLCVHLQRHADVDRPGRFRFLNLGQEGASLQSYDDNARFAVQQHHADRVVIGVLLPDDSLPFDVNARDRVLIDHLSLRVAATIFGVEKLLSTLPAMVEMLFSDFVAERIVVRALEDLSDTAADLGVPISVYFYGYQGLNVQWMADHARQLAAQNPFLEVIGVLEPPPTLDWRIPGDGHPSGQGNAWFAEQLWPRVSMSEGP